MDERVERVAKAIDEAVQKWQPGCGMQIKEMAARAAIEAIEGSYGRTGDQAAADVCGPDDPNTFPGRIRPTLVKSDEYCSQCGGPCLRRPRHGESGI